MSEAVDTQPAVTEAAAGQDKRPQVETLLTEVFRLMEYPAKLDFKDMPDGSLGVSVHFEGELPGITAGKRSYLLDSVQFWLNKVVNRPNVPRRWVNLAVDSFPEPRQPGQPREPREPREPAPAAALVAAQPPREKRPDAPPAKRPDRPDRAERLEQKKPEARPAAAAPQQSRRSGQSDERTLTPAADPALTAAGKLLAEKSAKHGRIYGVMLLTPDARSLMLKAGDEVKGVTAKAEGEGHWRRLVLVPEKLAVIAKKQVMPDYDDEEDE